MLTDAQDECTICGFALCDVVDVEEIDAGPACVSCIEWRQRSDPADRRQVERTLPPLFRFFAANRPDSLQAAAA